MIVFTKLLKLDNLRLFFARLFRWLTKTPKRKTAWILLIAILINQFVYPFIPFLKDNTVHANGIIEPVALGTSLFVNRNPDFNVWFGDRLDQSKHKIVFEVGGHEIEMRLQGTEVATDSAGLLPEVDKLIDELRQDLQKPYLTAVETKDGLADAIEQKVSDTTKIRYEILPDRGVKESILINEPSNQVANNQYAFSLKLSNGVQLKSKLENLNDTKLNASGSAVTNYYFTDSKNKYLANFEPLVMIDAAGAKSSAVQLNIEPLENPKSEIRNPKQSNQNSNDQNVSDLKHSDLEFVSNFDIRASNFILTLTADPAWLADPLRVYPVNLDPTIVHEQNPDFSSGTENRTQSNSLSAVEGQYKESQPDINTAGLWHFNSDNANEQTLYDSSGNTNDLTRGASTSSASSDPLWSTSGQVGHTTYNTLEFDGSDDYLTRADDADFDFAAADNFTVEAWVKHDNTTSAAKYILTKADATTGGYKLYMDASGDLCFDIDDDTVWTPDDTACTSAIDYDDNAWHHVAGVKYGTTAIKLYVDGKEVATDTAIAATATLANTNALYIGVDRDGTSNEWDGLIDEVAISRVARSPEEIAAHASRFPYAVHESPVIDFGSTPNSLDSLTYSATGVQTGSGETPFSTDGLVAQWNFNETSGTAAYNTGGTDSCSGTPSGCNLTLNNFASTSSQDQAAGTGWTANDRRWGAGAINVASAATADTISLSNPSALDPNSADLSLETWVKTNDVTAELFSNNSANGVSCTSDGYYLGIDASGYPVFTLDTDGATAGCDATITTGITKKVNDGNWHHLTATVTRGSAAYLYMDGTLIGSDTSITAYSSEAPSGNVLVGSTNAFDGTLDALRFYARALTTTEVLANSQSGLIEFQTRTGATSTPNDGTWEAWKTTSGTGDTQIDAVDSLSPVEKISQTSLTAYWKLDETSGTRADSKGSNTLTDNATVTYAPGRLSNAGQFTAANSEYLSITDNADLSTGDIDFTVGGWVYMDSTAAYAAISKYKPGTNQREYIINFDATNKLRFFVSSNGTDYTILNSTTSISTGTWVFVVAWHDATANTINIQVNNGTVDSSAYSSGVYDGTAAFQIGGYDGASGADFWNGKIDEVAFWKRTLTADERARLYQDGLDLHGAGSGRIYRARDTTTKIEGTASEKLTLGAPQVDGNTVGLWHLEETSGTGAYIQDATANANHGTPTGTTVTDGFFGKARSFNGTSDYTSIPDHSSLDVTNALTIETWVKKDSSSVAVIASKGATSNVEPYALWYSDTGAGNRIALYLSGDDVAANRYCPVTSQYFSTGVWHHIAATYNGTVAKIYVDGIEQSTSSGCESSTVPSSLYNSTGALNIGRRYTGANYFDGSIDEVRISNVARSAEEIAEGYRAGRDHRISKTISSTDLSAKTKLPFYVASDRPGTFMEATIGESDYANGSVDSSTVGLWHLEEQTGSGAYIKDSSGNGNNGTPTGTTFVQGKIGKGRSFNGSSDKIILGTTNIPTGTNPVTVDAWFKPTSIVGSHPIVSWGQVSSPTYTWFSMSQEGSKLIIRNYGGPDLYGITAMQANQWYHGVIIDNGTNMKIYLNGNLELNQARSSTSKSLVSGVLIGTWESGENVWFAGSIDEVRISNIARTADEIRQAYEIGKRTHSVTIDFKADLDSTNLIANTSDLSFAINPDTDVMGATLNLAKGDKIIVRENVGGTEYIAQGTVTNVTYASDVSNANTAAQALSNANATTVTVQAWDSGATVPTGGFTTSATVFKWQREYMDLTGVSLASQRDAVTRLTMRVTDGSQGATVWLDDFESADYSGGPMTGSGSTSLTIGSTANRYFQYRAILSTQPLAPSPTLNSVQINYNSGTTPQPPRSKDSSTDFSATGATLDRVTDMGSANSPQLELAYKELPNDNSTVGLWHMNENAANTCTGGVNDVCDASGNVNDGAFNGNATHTTSSKLGASATTLDGTGDYVDVSGLPAFSFIQNSGVFTIESWIKLDNYTQAGLQTIAGNTSASAEKGFYFIYDGTNDNLNIFLAKGVGGTGIIDSSSSNNIISDNNWHHIAVVGNGTNITFYVDGVSNAGSGTMGTKSSGDSTRNLSIGNITNASYYLDGTIDEVRISNIARTPEEIKLDAQRRPYGVYTSDVQNLGKDVSSINNLRWTENGVQTGDGETPYNSNGLVAAWNFNETSGATAANNAGTGSCGGTPSSCNGTLNNFASTASQDQAAGTGWTKDNRRWPARNASQSDAGGGAGAIMIASAATADTITVSDPASNTLDPNSLDLTIGMWVKTNDISAELFSNNATNGTACTANGYYLGIDSSGYPVFYLDTDGATAGCDAQISTGITTKVNDGNWHYLAIAVTRGTSAVMYLDGLQIGSDTSVTSYASITVTGNIQIASSANYDGVIDVINFYSRALGASEILAN
ncbi:MAG: LamG domain-containing protein, partial [Patescibacteria group bacterium]